MVYIDSNIPMYVSGREHAHREPSRRFLEQVRAGQIDACTSTEVLQEILYRYHGLRRLDLAQSVYDLFVQICPVVLPVTLADTDRAKSILCGKTNLGARDAIHAAVMLNNDIKRIATYDAGFDTVVGIKRLALE
ncbi:MAG: type II toxin-antitoxin system VapC family toxin [Deltaproteobacteria bacterium]|nr:type II toxin-antitoxin system VapC family toxin [Deltaproteobacteria bacterium]